MTVPPQALSHHHLGVAYHYLHTSRLLSTIASVWFRQGNLDSFEMPVLVMWGSVVLAEGKNWGSIFELPPWQVDDLLRVINVVDAKVRNISSMGSETGVIVGEEDIEETIIRRWGKLTGSRQNHGLRRSNVLWPCLVVGTVLSLVGFPLQFLVNSDANRKI